MKKKKYKSLLILSVILVVTVVIIAVITISSRGKAEITSKYMAPVEHAETDSIQ